jgi:indolepyruvate ferredoxin oxidoreductase beta subunit
VTSHVRFGDKVYSPLIPEGEADVLMAAELLEALRWLYSLRPSGRIVVNTQRIPPPTVARGEAAYPEDALERLRAADAKLIALDCLELAEEAGNVRTATVALLGGMSGLLPFAEETWLRVVEQEVPAKVREVNKKAFLLGRERGRGSRLE